MLGGPFLRPALRLVSLNKIFDEVYHGQRHPRYVLTSVRTGDHHPLRFLRRQR